ncbi:hypothetical protein D3C71_1089240 [compost metagenome]
MGIGTNGSGGARHGGLLENGLKGMAAAPLAPPPGSQLRDQIRLCPSSLSTSEA